MVLMSLKSRRGKLFEQPPDGVAVDTHATLLDHHVPLLVKLAHNGMQKALRLQIGPQLQPVLGERIEVVGLVIARVGVKILTAVDLHDLGKFVGLHVFVGFGDGISPGLFQVLQFLLVPSDGPVARRDVSRVSLLHFLQGNFFGGVILGADLVGALESHVLKHMRQPGLAERVLHRTGIHVGEEGKYRCLWTLADHDRQPVVQFLDRSALLERSNILCGAYRGEYQNNGERLKRAVAAHWTSTRLDANEGQKFEITWRKGKLSNAGSAESLQSSIRDDAPGTWEAA